MIFNINDSVKVKLNAQGVAIIEALHNEIYKMVKSPRPFHLPMVDEEGYTRFQLWDLMEIFGPHVGLGRICPFDTNIMIPEKKGER
jgi:hypothetical protein